MSENAALLPSYLSRTSDQLNFHQRSTDGFLNASVLCQKFGLQIRNWLTQPETLAKLISLDYELRQPHRELNDGENHKPTQTKFTDWSTTPVTIATIAQRFPNLVKYARASHQLDAGCWIAPPLLDSLKKWLESRPAKLDITTAQKQISYHCSGIIFTSSHIGIKLWEHNGLIEVSWIENAQRKFNKWLQRYQTILMVGEIAAKYQLAPQPLRESVEKLPSQKILANLYPQLIQIIPERQDIWLQSEVAKAFCHWANPDYNRVQQQHLIRTIDQITQEWHQRQQLGEYCWTINPPKPLHQDFQPHQEANSLRVLSPHERIELLDKPNCTLLRLWMTDRYAFLFCLENGLFGFPHPESLTARRAEISLDAEPLCDTNLHPDYGFFPYQSALKILAQTPSIEVIEHMLEQWEELIAPYLEECGNSTTEQKIAVTHGLDALGYRSPYWQENTPVVSLNRDEIADNYTNSGAVSKAVRTTVEFAGVDLELFMLPNGEYLASQTSTSASLDKDNTSIMRFSTSSALKGLLGKEFELCSLTVTGSNKPIKAVPLEVVSAYWMHWCKKGDAKATQLVGGLIRRTLRDVADEAFGIKQV